MRLDLQFRPYILRETTKVTAVLQETGFSIFILSVEARICREKSVFQLNSWSTTAQWMCLIKQVRWRRLLTGDLNSTPQWAQHLFNPMMPQSASSWSSAAWSWCRPHLRLSCNQGSALTSANWMYYPTLKVRGQGREETDAEGKERDFSFFFINAWILILQVWTWIMTKLTKILVSCSGRPWTLLSVWGTVLFKDMRTLPSSDTLKHTRGRLK